MLTEIFLWWLLWNLYQLISTLVSSQGYHLLIIFSHTSWYFLVLALEGAFPSCRQSNAVRHLVENMKYHLRLVVTRFSSLRMSKKVEQATKTLIPACQKRSAKTEISIRFSFVTYTTCAGDDKKSCASYMTSTDTVVGGLLITRSWWMFWFLALSHLTLVGRRKVLSMVRWQ